MLDVFTILSLEVKVIVKVQIGIEKLLAHSESLDRDRKAIST